MNEARVFNIPFSLGFLSVVSEADKRQVLPCEALRHTEGIHRGHSPLIFKLLKVAGVVKAIHNGHKGRSSCKERLPELSFSRILSL